MFLIAQKGNRPGICHASYRYVQAKNKYMKDYYENKESSQLKYWDMNNIYRCAVHETTRRGF